MINIADIFSSLISNDKSIFSSGKIRVSNTTMYAVSVGQFETEQQAQTISQQISSQGGAGYVYHSGDYFVFTSLYDSIVDAKSVVEKLKTDQVQAKIVNINIPAITLSYKGKSREDILTCIEFFKQAYQELYSLSIEYDSGKITTLQVKDKIVQLVAKSKQILNQSSRLVSKENKPQLLLLENKLMSVNLVLQNLYDFQPQGLYFNSAIKYTYFKIILLNIEYAKQV